MNAVWSADRWKICSRTPELTLGGTGNFWTPVCGDELAGKEQITLVVGTKSEPENTGCN